MPPVRRSASGRKSKEKVSKYTYKTVKELVEEGRPKKRTYSNVYGIITATSTSKRQITIKDETESEVVIQITSTGFPSRFDDDDATLHGRPRGNKEFFDPDKLRQNKDVFHVGDVVRIHRLMTCPENDQKLCFDIRSIIVFPSFTDYDKELGEHELVIKSMAVKSTLEQYDKDRVRQLQDWMTQQVTKSTVSSLPAAGKKGITIVGQLVKSAATVTGHKILWIWDGTEPSITTTDVDKNSILPMSEKKDHSIEQQAKGKIVIGGHSSSWCWRCSLHQTW